jgi:DNA-binding response OmpR family regulator
LSVVPIRILLVEDDYLVATEAEHALSEAGFEVLGPVNCADDAIALALAEKPALIIMDIRLKGQKDGVDAAQAIFSKVGIRSIFATAHTTSDIRARAASAAPLDWLSKPYSHENLVERVKAALAMLKS